LLSFPGAAGHVLKNDQLKYFYDAWGSDKTYNHMAVGWTWAFDTPFKWTKQVASHFGGPRQGLTMAWPTAGTSCANKSSPTRRSWA
jgi:arylsulfatase A-like enzyme